MTSPAAERLFGGDAGYQTYGREQRGSMANKTDTLSEIDLRPCTIRGDPGSEGGEPDRFDATRPPSVDPNGRNGGQIDFF